MNDKTGWDCVRFWAQALEEKYPGTDLLSLQDRQLKEMLLSLDSAAGLPALPDDNVYFWAVKSAWSVVQNGADDANDVSDAYI